METLFSQHIGNGYRLGIFRNQHAFPSYPIRIRPERIMSMIHEGRQTDGINKKGKRLVLLPIMISVDTNQPAISLSIFSL